MCGFKTGAKLTRIALDLLKIGETFI